MISPQDLVKKVIVGRVPHIFLGMKEEINNQFVHAYNSAYMKCNGAHGISAGLLYFNINTLSFEKQPVLVVAPDELQKELFRSYLISQIMGLKDPRHLVAFILSFEASILEKKEHIDEYLRTKKQMVDFDKRKDVVFHLMEDIFNESSFKIFHKVENNDLPELVPFEMAGLDGATFGGRFGGLFKEVSDYYKGPNV